MAVKKKSPFHEVVELKYYTAAPEGIQSNQAVFPDFDLTFPRQSVTITPASKLDSRAAGAKGPAVRKVRAP
jgi:hypothetical protein